MDEDVIILKNKYRWCFYLAVFLLVIFLAYPYFVKNNHFGILDYANLPFHEAGHYIFFAFFGEFIRVLGGTLSQLAFPLGFCIYFFFFLKDIFAGSASLFWFFENIYNISVYMRDARFMILPMFSDPESHDWNYLFGKMKLLHESVQIADFFKSLAIWGMLASIIGMAIYLILRNPFKKQLGG